MARTGCYRVSRSYSCVPGIISYTSGLSSFCIRQCPLGSKVSLKMCKSPATEGLYVPSVKIDLKFPRGTCDLLHHNRVTISLHNALLTDRMHKIISFRHEYKWIKWIYKNSNMIYLTWRHSETFFPIKQWIYYFSKERCSNRRPRAITKLQGM